MMKVSSEVFRLRVLVNGRLVQEYRGPGNNMFIEGRENSKFELELTNLTPRRILVHPAVDGLSTMTGKAAAQNDSTDGYVLNPQQMMRVPGWRLNDEQVAQFFFAGQGQSYAEQSGQPLNKGVIACPVWEEKVEPVYIYSTGVLRSSMHSGTQPMDFGGPVFGGSCQNTYTNSVNNSVGNQVIPESYTVTPDSDSRGFMDAVGCREEKCVGSVQNLGTGFGEKTKHEVVSVSFVPQDHPTCTAIIYYDTREGLRTRGIKIVDRPKHEVPKLPEPFPRTPKTGCTPPKDWVG